MSALGAREDPQTDARDRESFYELIERLVGDVYKLLDHKLALATLEMKHHVESVTRALMLMVAGGLAATIGLALLAVAAALAIGRAIDSPAGGYVIVGAAIVVIGAIVIVAAKARLTRQPLAPPQTIDELRRDVKWMKHEVQKRSA